MVKRINFSIDEELLDKFKKHCKENCINQSAFIAQKMKEFIEEVKK